MVTSEVGGVRRVGEIGGVGIWLETMTTIHTNVALICWSLGCAMCCQGFSNTH